MRQHLLFASSLGLALLSSSFSSHAAPVLRVQVDQRGDFLIVGNALSQDCGAGTPPPVVGTVGACGASVNDSAGDVFWRSDAPTAGLAQADTSVTNAQARSTAVLTIPAGASVTHAYLYWAGTVGQSGAPDTGVILDRVGGFTQSVSALTTFSGANFAYQSVADVTALVQANGSGAYRVSDVSSLELPGLDSNNEFIGWYMVVLYTNPADPLRNLAVFDGLDLVSNNSTQDITLSGFLVPTTGYGARLGVVTFEGDSQLPGDQLRFNGTALSDAMNPANNFFNGTRSFLGAPVTVVGDLPQLTGAPGSYAGLDMDVVDVTAFVAPGQTSAALQASTTNDVFHLAAWVTSVSTFKPDFTTTTKSVVDLNGGDLEAGDVLEYTIVVANTGNDASIDTVLTDPIPLGTAFVPGSIEITAGANPGVKSDVADADQGELAAGAVVVRLGAGADGANGGTIAIGEGATVKFRVTVTATSGTITNQASIAAAGALGAPTGTWVSSGAGGPSTPTTIDLAPCSPETEICDGKDNDCDGAIDDGFDIGMSCSTGVGACEEQGTIQCVGTTMSACDATPGTPAEVETCGDDVDANCDGEPSDGCPPPAECQHDYECGTGQVCDLGACVIGCRPGLSQPQCNAGYVCFAQEESDIGRCEIPTVSTEGGGLPGCGVGRRGGGGDAGWLVLLGLPALAARRRRRR